MVSAKRVLNPLTDTPQNKAEVTKPFMMAYMQSEKATKEDIEWFKGIVSNPANQKEYINHITKEPYMDINIPVVRRLFCERFFPHLVTKKGKKTNFIDTIMSL